MKLDKKKSKLFDGAFGRYVLPGVILQSVLIGGGYATGREIVEFGAKFGALGWLGGIGIFIGFTIVSILTFEFVRIFKTYNYKSLLEKLIGKGWIIYDVVYVLLAVLIIAVMASATGEIVESTIGIPYWGGVFGVIVIVGILQFFGSWLIERFETYGTIALYVGYLIFGVIVISATWGNAKEVFATGNTSFVSNASIPSILWTGVVYVGYNLAVFPATLFTLKRQTTRKETVWSGVIAGVLMTIPWFLTYFAVMGFYPNADVLGASVPWLAMMQGIAGPGIVAVFGVVVGWTLIETSTGIIHGLLDRIDGALEEKNKPVLTGKQNAMVTVAVLITATIFAKVGIIGLIAKGYTYMAYAMIIVFLVPLLTVGVYKIATHKEVKEDVQEKKTA